MYVNESIESTRRERVYFQGLNFVALFTFKCNGVELSKDKTQAAESVKWRPQQAYGSNHVLLAQPQTVFSTPKMSHHAHA